LKVRYDNTVAAPRLRWTFAACAAIVAAFALANSSTAFAVQIKKAGKLSVPPNATLVAFSTDPTIQQVLSQDFGAAHRNDDSGAHSVLTVSVTVSDQMLKPGVSLNELAPGDPQVADLIKAAGATPPPIGDTGDQFDEAAMARARMARNGEMPRSNPMEQILSQLQGQGNARSSLPCDAQSMPSPGCQPVPQETPRPQPGSPDFTGDTQQYMREGARQRRFSKPDDNSYDTVIVARATLSGAPEELTVVAVVHPGQDVHDAKKLVAEEIANAVLR
jgi:hypothetical protein